MRNAIRRLERRKDNASTWLLLVIDLPEGSTVVGAWDATSPKAKSDWEAPGDLDHWSETWPDETDPEAYGEPLDPPKGEGERR